MNHEAIIEAAARALKDNPGTAFQTYQELAGIAVTAVTPLIRTAALEEAAKEVEEMSLELFHTPSGVAAAIRALKEQP